ncbi:MAG TPA: hypothetical protein VF668_09785 [Pyrinomonadaceae bacterium]|jgi:hypothetical protein
MAQESSNNGPADATTVLPDDIRESIALGSFASVAGQPSSLSNLAYGNAVGNVNLSQQNTVAHQQALNAVGQTVTGSAVNLVANLSPMEAVAAVKLDTGNDVAEQLADLKAIVSGFPRGRRAALPRILRNPKGGFMATVPEKGFPVELVLNDRLRRPFVTRARKGGYVFFLKSSNFPFTVSLAGDPARNPTPLTVARDGFPVVIHHKPPPNPTPTPTPPTPRTNVNVTPPAQFPVQIIIGVS